MPYDLVPSAPPPSPDDGMARLLAAFLSGRAEATFRAYRQGVRDFAAFLGAPTPEAAVAQLLAAGLGGANELALRWRTDLAGRGLATGTVNLRLASLRSLVQMARTIGLVSWSLEIRGLPAEPMRDTRGPGREGFQEMLAQLDGRTDAKGVRDRAILRLLYDLALRRCEVCGLDLADVEPGPMALHVRGKGRRQRERMTLPAPTAKSLADWLAVRPPGGEALFVALRRNRGNRLGAMMVYRLIRDLGEAAGFRAWPHGLRHAAITAALDATNGDVRQVQRFSRHKKMDTLLVYDDRRRDGAADVARQVADGSP